MKFNAILLAGGLSSRMGRNKALLPSKGRTLLKSAFENLKSVFEGEGIVLVSGNYAGFPCVTDERPERGPIEGLWACTRKIPFGSAVLVTPVDMPLLTAGNFRDLLNHFRAEKILDPEIQCVQFENYEMPFVFAFDFETEKELAAIRDCEIPSQRSLHQFKNTLVKKDIKVKKSGNFKNVNTPEDWKEVCGDEAPFECP